MPTVAITSEFVSVRIESERLRLMRKTPSELLDNVTVVPLHDVERVVVVGRPLVSLPALLELADRAIPVYFLTVHGRWAGVLHPDGNLDASRRLMQVDTSRDGGRALAIARRLVETKILNSRRALQRLSSNRGESERSEQVAVNDELDGLSRRSRQAANADELRGIEGLAAARYFGRLGAFFPETVPFGCRSRRPPRNAANALLSWTYAVLLAEVDGAVRARGLDAAIGFLHEIDHGRPSLALDLIEPLRAPVCDLLALNMLNHRILAPEHFETHADDGGVYLREVGRKPFFLAYEQAMTRRFAPAKGAPHTDFRRVIQAQVDNLLRALEGHDDYSFFVMP